MRMLLHATTAKLLFLLAVAGMQSRPAVAFHVTTDVRHPAPPPFYSTSSVLSAKVKRGKLGLEVDAAASAPPRRDNKSVKRKTMGASSGNISPALAEWMASQQQQQQGEGNQGAGQEKNVSSTSKSTVDERASISANVEDDELDTTTNPNKKKKGSKSSSSPRVKQSARKVEEDARDAQVVEIVQKLDSVLAEGGSKTTLDDILIPIRQLIQLPTANFKQLTAGSRRQDFRLAWVGSDEAICHLGTGLHKVPLARLQEVFLSFMGRNRIEVQEVIRILGPFPNVKNTLQGQSSLNRSDDLVEWRLTWDSMIDGTGKEILAGKEDNQRRVDLHVCFSNASVVVAVVPPDSSNVATRRADPLENNGSHVLVFIREDNLSDKLEILRVG